MPQTELIYFSTHLDDSWKGTLRGLIAFIVLCIGLLGLGLIFRKFFKSSTIVKVITLLVTALVLCSAVAVQLPKENDEAFLYGLLVGLCISTIFGCLLLNVIKIPIFYIIISIIYMSLLVGATSLITYKLADQFNIY